MTEDGRRSEAVAELQAALNSEDLAEKNYHVREALQLLELDDRTQAE